MARCTSTLCRSALPLAALLVAAGILRFYHLQQGLAYHPDERHMIMVTMDLSDHGMNPRSFAYGSFSYYLLWVTAKVAALFNPALFSYDNLFLIGRSVCVVGGLLGIALTYFLAREVYRSVGIALVAAALLAFNTFHLQLSRFFTSDILLTTLCTGALLAMVRLSKTGSWSSLLAGGALFGVATATKISSVFLLPSLALALLFSPRRGSWREHLAWCVTRGAIFAMIGVLTFALVEPFAFLDFETFMRQTREQTDMVQGKWRPPYTIQYAHTTPYIYPLAQIFFYTMGIPLALTAGLGLISALARQVTSFNRGEWIIGAWIVIFFLMTAGFQVKFPRYLMPIYPELFVLEAAFLWQLGAVCCSYVLGESNNGSQRLLEDASTKWHTPKQPLSTARGTPMAVRPYPFVAAGASPRPILAPLVAVALLIVVGVFYARCRAPLHPTSSSSWTLSLFNDEEATLRSGPIPARMRDLPPLPNLREVGNFTGQFKSLMGVAVDSSGNIYGVDCELHNVQKYSPDGKLLLTFGGHGSDHGKFKEPRGIAVDEQDFVYVMDTWNGRVQKFTSDGTFVAAFGTEQGLFGPRAVTVRNGLVYVVDSGGGRVVVYTTRGEYLRTFCGKGTRPGQLNDAVGIAVTPEGLVYVLDSANDRVQKFSAEGIAVRILHVPGWNTKGLKEAHLAFSPLMGLFVADPLSGSIAVFGADDTLVGRIGEGWSAPSGVAVRDQQVVTGERGTGLIRTFRWEARAKG